MSASSDCTYVEVMGSSSAVGVALRKSWRMGRSKLSRDHAMNFLRSTLLIEPMGFNWIVWLDGWIRISGEG